MVRGSQGDVLMEHVALKGLTDDACWARLILVYPTTGRTDPPASTYVVESFPPNSHMMMKYCVGQQSTHTAHGHAPWTIAV